MPRTTFTAKTHFPHHSRAFTNFASPINLTTQAKPTPDHCACMLWLTNGGIVIGDTVTYSIVMADGVTTTISIPPGNGQMFYGAFRTISSVAVAANGAAAATAFWGDFGDP